MTEIEVGGQRYRIGRLDAIAQFHIARRLTPVQLALGISSSELAAKGQEADEMAMLAAIMGPIADVVSKMPEDDVNYILRTCLSVTLRDQGGDKWAKVMVSGNMMFSDIEMPHMLRLVIASIQENLGSFFGGLPGAA